MFKRQSFRKMIRNEKLQYHNNRQAATQRIRHVESTSTQCRLLRRYVEEQILMKLHRKSHFDFFD